MGNSTSAPPRISDRDKAILDMKNQRDKLHQYQKRITLLTAREKEIAAQCLREGNKSKALLALRKKRYQESMLKQTDQQLAQLEMLTADVEFALVQKDVVFGLQQGTKVLRDIQKEMGGVDRVELIMGETAEAQAYQREIDEMLAGRMSNHDEDEVEDELAAMAAEVNGTQEQKQRINLPDAPNGLVEPLPQAPTGIRKEMEPTLA